MKTDTKYPAIAAKFQAIAGKVTTEDIMRTALEMGCHYETVKRYLSGRVSQKGYGEMLLHTLEKTISNREIASK